MAAAAPHCWISAAAQQVTASSVSIYSSSLLAVDAGRGSSLGDRQWGRGRCPNRGQRAPAGGSRRAHRGNYFLLRLFRMSGKHGPEAVQYQALGGTLKIKQPLVYGFRPPLPAQQFPPLRVNLGPNRRVFAHRTATAGKSLGASFLAPSPSRTHLSSMPGRSVATLLNSAQRLARPRGNSVLNGWTINASGDGYASGDPVYLSLGGAARIIRPVLWPHGAYNGSSVGPHIEPQ